MMADYFLKLFRALMVWGPWFFGSTVLIAVVHRWKSSRESSVKGRTFFDRGLVSWILKEADNKDVLRVAINLKSKGCELRRIFVGNKATVPYWVVEGSVVEIKYLVPKGDKMALKVEILSVADLVADISDKEKNLLNLRKEVRDIRGGDLPESVGDG